MDWEKGPVRLADLEDLTLARNHIQHEVNIMTVYPERTADYKSRFPDSPYQDRYGFDHVEVTKESLVAACERVAAFCRYVDEN